MELFLFLYTMVAILTMLFWKYSKKLDAMIASDLGFAIFYSAFWPMFWFMYWWYETGPKRN